MNIPLDEQIYFDAITTTPSTGAAVDADSAPTFAVYEESTDTDIGVGGSMTKRTSLTGNYRGSFTLSAANGFEVGKWYSIVASGVVGGVTGKSVLKNFRVVAAEVVAGKPKVDADALAGQTITAAAGVTFPSSVASPTNITAGAITTVTNLTNAPTSGDLTATMKTSVTTAATAATPIAASVTGNVGGNVTGSVGSVVSFGTLVADIATAVWAAGTRTLTSISDSSGMTTLLTRIVGTLASGTHNAQSGDSFARIGAPSGDSISADIAAEAIKTATIKAKTDNLPSDPADQSVVIAATDAILTAVGTRATPEQVNAEVLDVLNVDTFAELSAPPAATSSLRAKLTWLFMWARNRSTQTSTERKLYADDATTVVGTEAVSDDGTTYSKGEAS